MADRTALYDAIGTTYAATRVPDARLAAAIDAALGDARSVVNVGAGAGAYEPAGRDVLAVEPSAAMIAQRPAGAAPAVQGSAEVLPLGDGTVDAAMAVLSDHHWPDRAAGLRELVRVARRRIVLVNTERSESARFWLTREYLPGFVDLIPDHLRAPGSWVRELEAAIGRPVRATPFPVPHDFTDGFYAAFWRRPEAYLDPVVRANISVFHRVPAADVDAAMARLADDLATGAWADRHADLLEREALDVGLRIAVAELA